MGKTLYYNGTILTMDRANPRAEALLTENGRIVAVGDLHTLSHCGGAPFDLQGATLIPGFVDGHSHMMGLGLEVLRDCDLMGCESFEEMLDRLRRHREERGLTHGEPFLGKGYDPAILREGRHPDAALLDSLGFDNPIGCIHQSGHIGVYNTIAMQRAGVLSADYTVPEGGMAGRDSEGHLTGYFEETARNPFKRIFVSTDPAGDMEKGILQAQDMYIRQGFTTVQDGSSCTAAQVAAFGRMAEAGGLKVDTVIYLTPHPNQREMRREVLAQYGRGYRGRLKIGGVKMFLDGSPQARTAWLSRPYEGETDYCGYPRLTDAQAADRMAQALSEGWQVMAHCNGDAACEQFLATFTRLRAEMGLAGQDLRPVMIHAQTVRYDQLERMAQVGMMASFFVDHCYFWGDTHLQNLGQRAQRISPAGRALALGIPFSFHQDCPVTRPSMIRSVWCAVNRLSRRGVVVGAENRIDPYDALIATTRGGAYTYFEENTKGILRAGALADLAVLDGDPTAVAPADIRDIKVLYTIKEDQILYRA